MATELKGLNYFPVDIRFFQCDKIAIIEAEYGLKALAIVFKLLCRIYSEGFYMVWDERACKLFRLNACAECSADELQAIVGALVKEGFFSAACFEKYGVLTSKGIQRRFFEAASRRKRMVIERAELLLIEPAAGVKKTEDTACTPSSADLHASLALPAEEVLDALARMPAEEVLDAPAGIPEEEASDTPSGVPAEETFPHRLTPSSENPNADISGKNAPFSSQRREKEKRETKRILYLPTPTTSSFRQAGEANDKEKNPGVPIPPLDTPAETLGAPISPTGTQTETSAHTPAKAPDAPMPLTNPPAEAPTHTPAETPDAPPPPFSTRCRRWRETLLRDEDWLASVVRISGKGSPVLAELPAAMALFEDHITTIGERHTLAAPTDYTRRFVSWWRCLRFRPAKTIASATSHPHTAKSAPASAVQPAAASSFAWQPLPPAADSIPSPAAFPSSFPTGNDSGSRAEKALQTSDTAAGIALQLIGQS